MTHKNITRTVNIFANVRGRDVGSVAAEIEQRRYKVRLRVPSVPCQDVLEAIPTQLVPRFRGFRLSGDFDMDIRADVSYADLSALKLGGKVGISHCRITGQNGSANSVWTAAFS